MSSKIPKFLGLSRDEIEAQINKLTSRPLSTPIHSLEQKLKQIKTPELRFIENLIEEGSKSVYIYFEEPYNEKKDIGEIKSEIIKSYVLEQTISRLRKAYSQIRKI